MVNIGERIKTLRTAQGLSQAELAGLLKISVQAVSKWENNLSEPSAQNVFSLIEIFGKDFVRTDKPQEEDAQSGMTSIRTIYKIGRGPSSSHTIAPQLACEAFRAQNPSADAYRVVLYQSLAKTGVANGIDRVIKATLAPIPTDVTWDTVKAVEHPNTMELFAYRGGVEVGFTRAISIGGGNVLFGGEVLPKCETVYSATTFSEIEKECREQEIPLWKYVKNHENPDLWEYLSAVWAQMKRTIKNGLKDEGILPGGLGVQKKAKQLLEMQHIDETAETKQNRLISAYAFATGEQNASFETVVTGPTCGSAGVLPAVLLYEQEKHDYSDEKILRALATAGIIGNVIRKNASISGAECGCQAEIGSACAMAAAALGELFELNIEKIEYAAEIALEHHLGLTCDPVCGLVQIPCIERNAVAAMRAINAVDLASLLWNTRKISFDSIVKTMKETGLDLLPDYRETSEGGMAKNYAQKAQNTRKCK